MHITMTTLTFHNLRTIQKKLLKSLNNRFTMTTRKIL